MRINKFVALASGLSRRAADQAIEKDRVRVNNQRADLGTEIAMGDTVTLDGAKLHLPTHRTVLMLNKPTGFVSSRLGQGSQTIYDLLPEKFHSLKPVGRLDKESSGLLLLTDDGDLAYQLTHPRYAKAKIYIVKLDKPLSLNHQKKLNESGVVLEDGVSRLLLTPVSVDANQWQVTLYEGRNRQIRRTFAALGYEVQQLHRLSFGPYQLGELSKGDYQIVNNA